MCHLSYITLHNHTTLHIYSWAGSNYGHARGDQETRQASDARGVFKLPWDAPGRQYDPN